jgi:hypothetical protein
MNRNSSRNFLKFKFKKLNLTFSDYLNPCKTKNRYLLDSAIEKFYTKLDVINLIHKLHEIEKMKVLFMNKDQRKIFELLPKPSINSISIESKKINSNSI